MTYRAVSGCALALGVLLGLNQPAASACNGGGCADGKPLDIMQFMREQAASTRGAKPQHGNTHAKSRAPRRNHRAVASRPKPSPMPADAAASFAARPEQQIQENVEVVASGQANIVDRAADAAPAAETTGAAVANGPAVQLADAVQLVDATEFNDIDRKADDGPPFSADTRPTADNQTRSERANSWLGWLWSAVASTFTALATAVRQLTHV